MSTASAFYPPTPADVPLDLTAPTPRYRLQVAAVLASLVCFVVLYLALVAGSAYAVYWSVTFSVSRVDKGTVILKLALIAASSLLFLFLLKGLFKRQQADPALRVEVKEKDQPVLFAFIRRLCEETGAPFPRRVYLSPEVNAAVFYNSSFLSLFLPTRKNLLIGLGLVNVLNLTEFKAVLAHEFGHFSQKSMKVGAYVYVANRIIGDMVYGRDWLDDLLSQLRRTDIRIAVFAYGFGGILWGLRKFLEGVFRTINFAHSALSRQMEFNADRVAVSVAGSDAIVHSLARLDFAQESLMQAWQDLATAADHRLYTCDLFYHQNCAARYLRTLRKDPHLGEPPPVPDDPELTVEVFEPGDTGVPLMWATHPSNYDREQNAKRPYIRTTIDDRSPWLLFREPARVREDVTWKFYREVVKLKNDVVLVEPEAVQNFIDDEHAETTYNERYHGLYDDRYINPGSLDDLLKEARQPCEEWSRLGEVHAQLYGTDLKTWMEAHVRRRQEQYILAGLDDGELQLKDKDFEFRGSRVRAADAKRLRKTVERELEEDRERLASLDRKVFLLHYRMAHELGGGFCSELESRYRFHLGVQGILNSAMGHRSRIESALQYLSGKKEVPAEEFAQVVAIFREAHSALKDALDDAENLRLPAMKNMNTGEPLRHFLLEQKLVRGLAAGQASLEGEWIGRFMGQLGEVGEKVKRIHFKSLGGILALQETITEQWTAAVAAIPDVSPIEPCPPEDKG
jgi:Zn-dependent protease with chaperone function